MEDNHKIGKVLSIEKDGKTLYYAEFRFRGRRFKHNYSPNRGTVEKWLERKLEYIKQLEGEKTEKYQTILSPQREITAGKTAYNKNGVRGCIYENVRRRPNGKVSKTFVAEINYLRYRCRRESDNRDELEAWLDLIAEMVNGIIQNRVFKEKMLSEDVKMVMANIKAEEDAQVGELFDTLRIQDRKGKSFFVENGLCRRSSPITYVLFNPTSGLYKIGKTKDLYRRFKSYCIPELEVVQVCEDDIEQKMHDTFFTKRMEGEWFSLTDEELEVMVEKYGFRKIPNPRGVL